MNELERFSAGEEFAVNPDAIERELASIWRAAGQSSDGGQPVTRACLWNVVVHVEERNDADGQLMLDMVAALPRHLAARALVLRTRDEAEAKASLESWISANCILSGDGGKLVCSEEITLASRGDGDRHLPSLVRALMVPAIPTAGVFDGVPADDEPTRKIVRQMDRLIVHADRSKLDRPLSRIRELASQCPGAAMDVGWLAQASLRQEIAALFDPPRSPDAIHSIQRVVIRAPEDRRWSARLLLAWIGNAVGRPIELIYEQADQWNIRMDIPSESTAVEVCGHNLHHLDVTDERGTVRQPKKRMAPAALVARALSSRGEDHAFLAALERAEDIK